MKTNSFKKAAFLPLIMLFSALFISNSAKSQNPVVEFNSGRIVSNATGSSFYFRILEVSETDFNAYAQKAKEFPLFDNYRKGYSAEYRIGSLYFTSAGPVTLINIQSLMKTLGVSSVMYDGKNIPVSQIQDQKITVVERNPAAVKPRQ
jgi:hypothetical protein